MQPGTREPLHDLTRLSERPPGPPDRPGFPHLARLAVEGGVPGKYFAGAPRHTQSGGRPPQNRFSAPPQPSKRPHGPPNRPGGPSFARLTAEGGVPEKNCRAPETHTIGGEETIAKFAAYHPDPVSAQPGHQPGRPPPILHALQQRGRPLAKFLRGPTDTHNPWGGPLTTLPKPPLGERLLVSTFATYTLRAGWQETVTCPPSGGGGAGTRQDGGAGNP